MVCQRPSRAARAGARDEVGGGGVEDAVAGLDRLVAERDREMRFADAGRPDQQDVGLLFDEPQGRELVDHACVQGGLGVAVELREGLAGRQL